MPLDLTTITGTIYAPDGTPVPRPTLQVVRAVKEGVAIWRNRVTYTGEDDGSIEFTVPRDSVAYIYASADPGLNNRNGTAVVVPDSATADLEELLPAVSVTVSGVTSGQLATVQASVDALQADFDALDATYATDAQLTAEAATRAAADTALTTAVAGKQPIDADLTAIAALAPSNDDLLQRKAGAWTSRTPAQVKTDLALTKSDVGLANVDNTSDAGKPVSTAQQAAIDAEASARAAADAALQPLDSDLTAISALSPSNDDVLQRKGGAWANRTPAQLKTDLALVKGDVGLGNVDNTSDATKNAAVATLTNKTLTAPVINNPTGLVKGDVGLGSVDNTADSAKPVSTAQAAADAATLASANAYTDGTVGVQPLVYVALLSQAAADAPVPTILKNTLGGVPVWAYSSQGEYTCTLPNAFTADKTAVEITSRSAGGTILRLATAERTSASVITVRTSDVRAASGVHEAVDELLSGNKLTIEVYP